MIVAVARGTLIVSLWFGAVSAVGGGLLGVLANGAGVPVSYLGLSPLSSYLIPGLLLVVVIGGTQCAAAILLSRRQRCGLTAAAVAGLGMIVWIFAELAVISEYLPLQIVYFALGIAELTLILFTLGLLTPFFGPLRPSVPATAIRPWMPEEL